MTSPEAPKAFIGTFVKEFITAVNTRARSNFEPGSPEDFSALIGTYAVDSDAAGLADVATFLEMALYTRNTRAYHAILNENGQGKSERDILLSKVTSGVIDMLEKLGVANLELPIATKSKKPRGRPASGVPLTPEEEADVLARARVGARVNRVGKACVGNGDLFDRMNPRAVQACTMCELRLDCLADDIAHKPAAGCLGGLDSGARKELQKLLS